MVAVSHLLSNYMPPSQDVPTTAASLYSRGMAASLEFVDPLPEAQRRGLIGIFICSVISAIAIVGLLSFITWRMITWRKHYAAPLTQNQYIVLIYNLLLADLHSAVGFIISIKFVKENSMYAFDAACFAQGFMIQIGDPLSGLFVLAIALHTVLTVATGKRLPHRVFVTIVVGLWVFVIVLALIPTLSHLRETMKPSGAWCWIAKKWEMDRLYTHYIWIFISEFACVVIYFFLFIHLQQRVKSSQALGQMTCSSIKRIRRVTMYMVIYPIAYIALSLPLAAARMADARNKEWSSTYHGVAGCFMACSGWVDVLLYAFTRKSLVLASNEPAKSDSGYSKDKNSMSYRKHPFSMITEGRKTGSVDTDSKLFATSASGDSEEGRHQEANVMGDFELGSFREVMQQTTIEIRSEPAPPAYYGNNANFDPLGSMK